MVPDSNVYAGRASILHYALIYSLLGLVREPEARLLSVNGIV
jgi:hypothetical protein